LTKRKNKRRSSQRQLEEVRDLQFVEYEITSEPIEDRNYKRLPRQVKDAIERLYGEIQRHPHEVIPELVSLIEKYPHIPVLHNYLSVAYSVSGQHEKAEEAIRENYRANPDYLFARLNYADLYLQKGEYKRVAEIFDHKFDLKLLYPKRKRFHVSEVTGFMGLMGVYFLETGSREAAEMYYEILQEVAPDDPMTQRLGKRLHPGCLLGILRRLAG
jgi:tetratricopeptide (TPR) repeat protein